MSDQLKGSSETREVVVREDGTKEIKVRRKKRRTETIPSTGSDGGQRMQVIQIAIFVVFVFVLILSAGGALLYANTKGFREKIIDGAELKSGAEIELNGFRMNPATANVGEVVMTWPGNHILETLKATGVVAKVSPKNFLGSSFSGAELVAERGNLFLNSGLEETSGNKSSDASNYHVSFKRYSIKSLNLHLGTPETSKLLLENCESSAFSKRDGTIIDLRLKGGNLKLAMWPSLQLERGFIKVDGPQLTIQSLGFRKSRALGRTKKDPGTIVIKGDLEFDKSNFTLAARVKMLPIKSVLGEDFGKLFSGRVSTPDSVEDGSLNFRSDALDNPTFEGLLTQSLGGSIRMANLPFLSQIARITGDGWYDEPVFTDKVNIQMVRNGANVKLEKFSFEQRSQLSVHGSLKNGEGGQISGTLSVGLPSAVIRLSNDPKLESLFSKKKSGYQWVELNISGNGSTPLDDFAEQYESALKKPMPIPAQDSFRSLLER